MPAVVKHQDYEVLPHLEAMHLPRAVLLDIFDIALGEWANVNDDDPVETRLDEMRRWLTRHLRTDMRLRELGWTKCKHGKIEGIKHDALGLKLAAFNTDARTGVVSKKPSNVSKKGPQTTELTEHNSAVAEPDMFGYVKGVCSDPVSKYDFWCFCVHASDESKSAEISRPIEIVGGFVRDFSTRVILLEPGQRPGRLKPNPVPEDFAAIETPSISRRKA
ncbi:hypothetical protein [uncultured Sphingomonas sp.]|uniref:hypothetical protein n=1 Tax=uncultured Sphingomonas sp. TaxID=158754 RepID=UPI00261D2830|nr:hypothetical protein [uncultured Sphingomonas sp.]